MRIRLSVSGGPARASWARYVVALALFVGVLAPWAAARAECVTNGIALFPRPGSVIPTNAELLLEGRGSEMARVKALIGDTLHLRTDGGEVVKVQVRKGWTSEMNRIAVRLVPTRPLKPNTKYTLHLEAELGSYRLLDDRGPGVPFWRSGAGADKVKPTWTKLPAPAGGRHTVDEGRVQKEIRFNAAMREESPSYVVVTMKRARGGSGSQTYFAPIDGTSFVVGHDRCSGSFVFDDGRAYFATVEGFDAAGNRAPPTKKIELHAPRQDRP